MGTVAANMISIILDLIPDDLKSRARDALVEVVAGQADEYLGRDAARSLRGLRSDAAFLRAFDEGLERALQRFVEEFEPQDEDLVAAIATDHTIFRNKEVEAALLTMLKRPGTYLVDEREEIVQTFASVLPGRKNRERVDRAVTYLLRCLAEELWHLPELQPVYSLHFQKGSYEAQRQQVELQKAQLQALTSIDAGLRETLLQLADAISTQRPLPAPQAVALLAPSKVMHNLPQPDYEQFVGREQELAEVHRLLSPQVRHFLITIDGIGGMGKSALALEAAHYYLRNYDQLPAEERFDAIVWATAKRTVLTTDGIVNRRQPLRTLDDLFSAIAIALQREDITRARPEDQDQVVRRALTRQRTLLIVDNLETVDDEQLLLFLRELPDPTKAIVTTRKRIDVAYAVRLTGMPWQDARRLILQECDRKQIALIDADALRLYERTGGVPLALVWTISLIGRGRSIDAVLARLGEHTDDIAQFCFEGSVEHIRDKPAHKVLMALAVFAADASRDALGRVADLRPLDRDEGLSDLEQLSLVNKRGNRFAYLPLTKAFAEDDLKRYPEFAMSARNRWLAYLLERCQDIGTDYYWRYSSFAFFEDSDELFAAIELSFRQSTTDNAPKIFTLTQAACEVLEYQGDWNRLVELCSQSLQLARSVRSYPHIARFLNLLGWILYQRGLLDEAEEAYLESFNCSRDVGSIEGQAVALQHLSGVQRKLRNYAAAKELCDQSWNLAQQTNDGDLKAFILTQYGKLARDMGQWQLAWQDFAEVRDYFETRASETPRDEVLARGNWGHLSIVALHLGRPQEAKDLALRSLQFFAEQGTRGYVGTVTYRLALAEEALGEYEAAHQHALEALDWFDRLGMMPDYVVAKALLDRLESKLSSQETDSEAHLD